ncbi:MAG: DNA methylase [Candidatus Hydrogenedentes bacterium]|nr:DNA methylase [Candidatus Hydrogenedentota bacterium]
MYKKPELQIQTTTLWEYPSQHYGETMQGDKAYVGATPSYVIWNLLQRYTREGDLIVDPMCGSGTTLDVARDLGRRALGYDVAPYRKDIFRADARKLPLEDEKADFVFVDPPYSTHIKYSEDPACIGKLDAGTGQYYEAMSQVIREISRVLRPKRYMALYVSDSWKMRQPFQPIGFRLFSILERFFEPVDVVCVVRHNRTMKRRHWHTEAVTGNYFLRGFNYLFIMKKRERPHPKRETITSAGSVKQSSRPKNWAKPKPPLRPKRKVKRGTR